MSQTKFQNIEPLQQFLSALINCSLPAERKEYWLNQIAEGRLDETGFNRLQAEVHESLHQLAEEMDDLSQKLSQEKRDLFALEHNVVAHIHEGVKSMNQEYEDRLAKFKKKADQIEAKLDQKIEKAQTSKEKGIITKIRKKFKK